MPLTPMTYAELGSLWGVSREAARKKVDALGLTREPGEDGKVRVLIDLDAVSHAPRSKRPTSPKASADHPETTEALQAHIRTLVGEVERLTALAASNRADFERERDKVEVLSADLVRLLERLRAVEALSAERSIELARARAEVEIAREQLAAWNALPPWRRMAGAPRRDQRPWLHLAAFAFLGCAGAWTWAALAPAAIEEPLIEQGALLASAEVGPGIHHGGEPVWPAPGEQLPAEPGRTEWAAAEPTLTMPERVEQPMPAEPTRTDERENVRADLGSTALHQVEVSVPLPAPLEVDLSDVVAEASSDAAPAETSQKVAEQKLVEPKEEQQVFTGLWAANAAGCYPSSHRRGYLLTVVSAQGAWAGETTCSFKSSRREGSGWALAAVCSDARKTWRSQVRLSVQGDRLTWASKNGTRTYVRCDETSLWARPAASDRTPLAFNAR